MQTVLLTPTFERQAEAAGLSEDGIAAIASSLAADPLTGDLMARTGGAQGPVRPLGLRQERRIEDDPLFRGRRRSDFLAGFDRQAQPGEPEQGGAQRVGGDPA
jgi:hypothetical protein